MKKVILTVLLVLAVSGVCLADYTGLVVDAKDLGVLPGMNPKIYDNKGNEIFGTVYVDPDVVTKQGIVDYANTMDEAVKECEVGSKPLIVKAVRKGNDPLGSDVVVSDADADKIIQANNRSNFLGYLRVAIIL